jgi:alkylhydroperoxidase/carboxymuconolactone decarboxylase family protein YurZ
MANPRLNHYVETLGDIPPAISTMFDMDEAFGEHYTDIRELIYKERSNGLSLAMKEMILVLLDITVDNRGGAINHLRAAQRAGLTKTQMQEMLIECFLVLGVSAWGKVGFHLWNAWNDVEEESHD